MHNTVNELRMLAKDAGLYFKDNHDNKCFDEKQWEAIKAWTAITKNNKSINKKASQNLYRFIREVSDSDYRTDKFWSKEPDYRDYTFDYLKEWCGLDLKMKLTKETLVLDIEKKF